MGRKVTLLKYSIALARPSRTGTLGSQSSCSLAVVMSGLRCLGSSIVAGRTTRKGSRRRMRRRMRRKKRRSRGRRRRMRGRRKKKKKKEEDVVEQ